MRVLIFIPQSRIIEPSLESIRNLDTTGHEVVFEFASMGDDPAAHRWVNVTHKYQTARKMALAGGYDALFCVEDDILVPPDALKKLDAVGADIAYGLVTWRREPHHWSAAYVSGPKDGDHETYDMDPRKMRAAWGSVIDVIGCGLFCTLIRRDVLEALDFELRGSRCCDFYHAWDAHVAGFTQQCDTSVVCGHVMNEAAPWQVVYPDGKRRFRYEVIASGAVRQIEWVGGPVSGDTSILVGTPGPEIIILPDGSRIHSLNGSDHEYPCPVCNPAEYDQRRKESASNA